MSTPRDETRSDLGYLPETTTTMDSASNAAATSPPLDSDKKDHYLAQTPSAGQNYTTMSVKSSFERHAAEVMDEAAIEAAGQETGTSFYIWSLTAISAISGMLFGYDTGAINSVLVQVGTDIGGRALTNGEKEFITSALAVGGIVGALIAGYLADKIGRKRTLVFCDFLFVIGAVVQAAIHDKWPFAVGRFIMGVGVGSASMIAPVFISEVAPVQVRGRLVTLNVVAITGGQVVATAIGAAFVNVSSGWRWIIAIGAVPPIFQAIVIELFFPESPRHLQKLGKTEEASKVLSRMYPKANEEQIAAKLRVLQHHIASDTKTIFEKAKDVVLVPQVRRAAFLAAWLQAAQQLCGFNSLIYYSASIFQLVGLSNSTATSLVISGVNFLVTIFAVAFLDRFGRRNFLKVSIPIMIFGLIFSAVVFWYLTASTDHYLREGANYDSSLGGVMIFAMVVFVAGYAGGLGHVPWSAGDFFSQEHRGVGASIGALSNWVFTLVVSSTFLRLLDAIRPTPTFCLYAGLSVVGAIVIYFCYPETLSLSLEQARNTLEGGFNVKQSEKLRKQNIKMLREGQADQRAAGRKDGALV